MMEPFDQDREEAEDAATEDEGNQEEEEANKAIAPKIPTKPSQEEVDAHMLTHLPFRSWCPVPTLRAREIKGESAQETGGNRKRNAHSIAGLHVRAWEPGGG